MWERIYLYKYADKSYENSHQGIEAEINQSSLERIRDCKRNFKYLLLIKLQVQFTTILLKAFSDLESIIFLFFENGQFFICGFSAKVTCAFLASETLEKSSKLSTFQVSKMTVSSTLLIRLSRVPLWIGYDRFELRRQSPLKYDWLIDYIFLKQEKPFKCNICGKEFSIKHNLRKLSKFRFVVFTIDSLSGRFATIFFFNFEHFLFVNIV